MKLVIFDCDGTLVDSQASIVGAMNAAFMAEGLPPPPRAKTVSVVGLSLNEAMAVLAPELVPARHTALVARYREAAQKIRREVSEDALFEGAGAAIRSLAVRDDIRLGIATGKSARGVRRLIEHNNWANVFVTIQTADDNPSKPSPVMIERAMAEAGIGEAATTMIGDTSYDMAMAKAAGVAAIGVTWGYHPPNELRRAGADLLVADFAALMTAIDSDRAHA
jgi:phosphoglycolate phosphatase